jgi:Fe-S oxidoreductase
MKKRTKEKKLNFLTFEVGYTQKEWQSRTSIALIYPNTYQVGMSNLGLHILYREVNRQDDLVCERVFFSDVENQSTSIRSIESNSLIREFDIAAFCLSFEIDGFHMAEMLRSSQIPLWAEERRNDDSLVIMGGPCPTFNPEPWAPFVDAAVIGEGEEILVEIGKAWALSKGLPRIERIAQLTEIEGLYIPSLYEPCQNEQGQYEGLIKHQPAPNLPISKRVIQNMSVHSGHMEIISSETEFGHMFLVEVARGCGRHCRFCMAGYAFRKPRVRDMEEILEAISIGKSLGATQIGLVGAAVSDHPKIDELCRVIDEMDLNLSVASLRADNVSLTLLKKLAKSGQRTVTFAPETGSERMRSVINKGLDEADLLNASEKAIKAGMKHIRLYAMLGLPTETDADIEALIELAKKIRQVMKKNHHAGKVILSVNPFIPKPFTPFEKMPLFNTKEIEKKIRILQKELPPYEGYEIKAESLRESWVQGILARGDRSLARVIADCSERGYRNFAQAFRRCGLSKEKYEYQDLKEWKKLPWSHIDLGVKKEYFEEELKKATEEESTLPCFEGCRRCGVCE